MHLYSPECVERLSEKGSEGGFEGGFGRYEEAEKGSKRAFTVVCRATPGVLPRLFGRSQKRNSQKYVSTIVHILNLCSL